MLNSIDTGHLVYLLVLGVAIGGYFVAASRHRMGEVMRHLVLWGLIFVGVMAAYGLWGDISPQAVPQQSVIGTGKIEAARQRDGHYYLTADVNGKSVNFVVDTGASGVVLTREDAVRVGLDLNALKYSTFANTANGPVRTARVKLAEVALGGLIDKDVTAYVNDGEMAGSLLGMSYLERFSLIEISGDRLILTR